MVTTLSPSPRSAEAAFTAASRALVMALALASLSLDLPAQKEVGYPDWVKSIVPAEPYVPAEYRGRHAIEIGEQFAVGPHRITARPFFVSHTTTSGVIAIVDSSSSEKVKKGWDTGFARVHSATRLPSTASHPLRLLCTVRDDSVSRCRVVEVRVTPRGDLSQRLIGPPSATDGALWTMATMIDGAVYLFDATSSSIIRIIDTSGDGAPDTIDPGFTVAFPASPDDPVRRHGLPIRRFARISPDLINLHADPDGGIVDLRLDPESPSLSFSSSPARTGGIIGLPLVVGQTRVPVSGRPGFEFRLESTSDEVVSRVSSRITVPPSGHVMVDLIAPLASGSRIRIAGSTDSDPPGGGPWLSAAPGHRAVLFRPRNLELGRTGGEFTLRGDRLKEGMVVHYSDGVTTGRLETTIRSSSEAVIVLPHYGPAESTPPFRCMRSVELWVADSRDDTPISPRIAVSILHG